MLSIMMLLVMINPIEKEFEDIPPSKIEYTNETDEASDELRIMFIGAAISLAVTGGALLNIPVLVAFTPDYYLPTMLTLAGSIVLIGSVGICAFVCRLIWLQYEKKELLEKEK